MESQTLNKQKKDTYLYDQNSSNFYVDCID